MHAVDRLSWSLAPGEVLGIVGESGCGKSVTSMAMLRLLPPTAVVTGQALFQGRDLLQAPASQLRRIRGREISFVFQEPMTSLNPVVHGRPADRGGAAPPPRRVAGRRADRAIELLDLVHIPAPDRRVDEYPHQLSGGMRQRVMIAMALACDPKILIADEPTTALDVTIQAGILDLLRELRERLGTAIVLITHNLGVVADIADRVLVMYAGRKAEEAPVGRALRRAAAPVHDRPARRDPAARRRRGQRPAPGDPGPRADAAVLPDACIFAPRCPRADELCVSRRAAALGGPAGSRGRLRPPRPGGRGRMSESARNRHSSRHRRVRSSPVASTAREAGRSPPNRRAGGARWACPERALVSRRHGGWLRTAPRRSRSRGSSSTSPSATACSGSRGGAVVHAVEDVSFSIAPGELLGLVGESGSGKSTVAQLRRCG